ncbi:MAG: hypothetical protein FWB86_12765 [Treponema sp.]|nr:hypothetical protein [Treponema sp.]MCL2252629.1 hypothetical protein [Treponema sp.]
MKRILFFVIFTIITFSAYGQQFLWSTVRNNELRYVPINNVTREVLEFYEQYRYYLDYSGFSKDRFIEMFDYGFEDWEWLYGINELTVFALRSNNGQGSVVLVMCISRDNVNTLIFTNSYERGIINTYSSISSERDKFSRWFRTIMN